MRKALVGDKMSQEPSPYQAAHWPPEFVEAQFHHETLDVYQVGPAEGIFRPSGNDSGKGAFSF